MWLPMVLVERPPVQEAAGFDETVRGNVSLGYVSLT